MKVKFKLGIGYTGKHEEIVEFKDDASEEYIQQCLEDWANNYIDWGYEIL